MSNVVNSRVTKEDPKERQREAMRWLNEAWVAMTNASMALEPGDSGGQLVQDVLIQVGGVRHAFAVGLARKRRK